MRHREEEITAGQDSFLDIVANIVGILLILLMVVGLRAKNAPVTLSVPGPQQKAAEKELQDDVASVESLRRQILETTQETQDVLRTKQDRYAERGQLALIQSALEHQIQERRGDLDANARADFDRRQALSDAEARLAAARRERDGVNQQAGGPTRVESYPTPLSKTVSGHELHLQLRGGRVAVIPWDELIAELKAEFRHNAQKLGSNGELSDQFGPIGGFRVRYTIRRHDVSMRTYEQTGQGGAVVQLEKFSLLPVDSQLGDTLEDALTDGSELRRALARYRPDRTTVTIWTYPDSFDEFRRLKKELYLAGYAAAARPLPEGVPIGGSPDGSRSAAE
jgi:hypothetical protein